MPKFSRQSNECLSQSHPLLREVFHEVIKTFDCTVYCGFRSGALQDALYVDGKTKAKAGQSPHNNADKNNNPLSLAVDCVPWPIDWHDRERMSFFAGYVLATARTMGIELRWGGDWDDDTHLSDNRFDDFPHFELKNWKEIALSA